MHVSCRRGPTIAGLLAVALTSCAFAAVRRAWQALPAPTDAPATPHHERVVDYGDNYAHYRTDQYLLHGQDRHGKPKIKTVHEVDLDGDGKKDDMIRYVEFDLEDPLPRLAPGSPLWNDEGTNWRFYHYILCHVRDSRHAQGITEGAGPNANHSYGADDLNMMGNDSVNKMWGLWLWKKDDFLHGADAYPVAFDEESRISLHFPRYFHNVNEQRFVVQDGEQFYISEYKFWKKTKPWGANSVLRPTETRWAEYNPHAPYHIDFDHENAEFKQHTFTDIRSAGYYIAKYEWARGLGVKMGAFEVEAVVTKPERPSELLNMVKIDGTDRIPEFYISRCEIPYEAWQKIYRWAVSNMYTLTPGYYFRKEGDMGAMALLDGQHGADEPATNMSWLDAVAWCNALSEYEGRDPAYYADPEHTKVFRRATERCFFDSSYWMRKAPDWYRTKYPEYVPRVYVKWDADGFRLPAASEWKMASDTSGVSEAFDTTRPVTSGKTNQHGLHYMIGNVWEWIWDAAEAYTPDVEGFTDRHTVLGGDFRYPADPLKHGASRFGDRPFGGNHNIGFRPVRREKGLKPPPTPNIAVEPGADMEGETSGVPSWTFTPDTKPAPPKAKTVEAPEVELVELPEGSYSFKNRSLEYPIQIAAMKMAKTETTFRQWKHVYDWAVEHGYSFNYDGDMGSMYLRTAEHPHGPDEPVTRIGWHDALVWCNALSEMSGLKPCYYLDEERTEVYKKSLPFRYPMVQYGREKRGKADPWYFGNFFHCTVDWSADGFRLPTSFEASYAFKGGKATRYFWGDKAEDGEAHGWVFSNSHLTTHPVGQKKANPFGLLDTWGNVAELCWNGATVGGQLGTDPYDRINPKGISGRYTLLSSGASMRYSGQAVIRFYEAFPEIGFRVVRCEAGTHPVDGDQSGELVLLDIPEGRDVEPLQGATFRANNNRDGNFRTSGVPEMKGVKWKFKTEGPVLSSPVMVDGTVYVGSHDGNLYALSAQTGEKKWAFPTNGPVVSSPTVYDGVVYFGSMDASLYAVDATNGEQLWRVRGRAARNAHKWAKTVPGGPADVASSPAVAYGYVFAGLNGRMRAFDARTGEEVWCNLRVESPNALGSPTVHKGVVLYNYNHTRMEGFRIRNAERILWCTEVGNDSQFATPAVHGGLLYHSGAQGVLYCHEIHSDRDPRGKNRWKSLIGATLGRTNTGKAGGDIAGCGVSVCSPAVADGFVVIGTVTGRVSAIDAETGREEWNTKVGEKPIKSSPGIADGTIYIGCDDGKLYALDLETGEKRWEFATAGPVVSSPCVGDGIIFVGSDDGHVYAVQ